MGLGFFGRLGDFGFWGYLEGVVVRDACFLLGSVLGLFLVLLVKRPGTFSGFWGVEVGECNLGLRKCPGTFFVVDGFYSPHPSPLRKRGEGFFAFREELLKYLFLMVFTLLTLALSEKGVRGFSLVVF